MFNYDFEGKPTGARASAKARLVAAVVAIACAVLLGTAATLQADDRGHGTHTQLGLPPCGFANATGMPCATCGMTTSFALAADGKLISAFQAQPFGALLAVAAAVTLLLTAYAAVSGLNLVPLLGLVFNTPVLVTLGALLIAGWGYKLVLGLGG